MSSPMAARPFTSSMMPISMRFSPISTRAESVRTTTTGTYNKPDQKRAYHVLAVVYLSGENRDLHLDQSDIFLIPQADVASASCSCDQLGAYKYSREQVERLFGVLAA